jgi:hypothetical protein
MDYKNYIQLTISQGINFSIGQAIKDGFAHLGKNVGLYIGFTVVAFFIIAAAAVFSMFVPLVGNFALTVLVLPPLMMGYALFARSTMLNHNPGFETFFDGFKTNYGQLIVVNLILQIIQSVLSLVFLSPIIADFVPLFQDVLASGQDPELINDLAAEMVTIFIENWWAFALTILVSIVIQVLYLLSNYFVIFYGFGFWEAMESSRQLITRVFFKIIILNILVSLIMFVGIIVTLGIGLLFLFPLSMLINFSVFTQIAGFADGEHVIENDLII